MRSLMILGTASHVGKSVLCTALCRIFAQDGINVAPFKAQNMSLNSAVTPSGREIGRAQAAQAEAAGLLPNEHMNPVLLKPTGDMRTQVVVQGQVYDTVSGRKYFEDEKSLLWSAVVESYRFLADRYPLIVMEGAGSPVEMNLKDRDIANLRAAEMADAVVVLVADIDRGGVFASVIGTLALMTQAERQRVKGLIINRFRGDPSLFADGVEFLEQHTGIPVLGVIPYVQSIGIDEEDSVGLESSRYAVASGPPGSNLRIAIVQLLHLSNFTDLNPLFLEPGVHPFFATKPEEMEGVDAVVLPGSKSTVSDLAWLSDTGWLEAIREAAEDGTPILGICGGYQMLGRRVLDPARLEGTRAKCEGLGLFPHETVIESEKRTVLVQGELMGPYGGIQVSGYEIHKGVTKGPLGREFARIHPTDRPEAATMDGAVSDDGAVVGTYLHGILHNDEFRTAWLNRIRARRGLPEQETKIRAQAAQNAAYDRVAGVVRANLNLPLLYSFLQ